jgi:hypothetical protein
MNDVAVAETMLMRLIGVAADDGDCSEAPTATPGKLVFAAGSVLGWHRRQAADIDSRLTKDWYLFARANPFWQRGHVES